jgi:hypothetical protein
MSEYKLSQEIIALSVSNILNAAKIEWKHEERYEAEEPGSCLFCHFFIIETCILRNENNRNTAIVVSRSSSGHMPSDKIFQTINRVRKVNTKSLYTEATEYAHNRGWIDD